MPKDVIPYLWLAFQLDSFLWNGMVLLTNNSPKQDKLISMKPLYVKFRRGKENSVNWEVDKKFMYSIFRPIGYRTRWLLQKSKAQRDGSKDSSSALHRGHMVSLMSKNGDKKALVRRQSAAIHHKSILSLSWIFAFQIWCWIIF